MLQNHTIELAQISYCGCPILYRYLLTYNGHYATVYNRPIIVFTRQRIANLDDNMIWAHSIATIFYANLATHCINPIQFSSIATPEEKYAIRRYYQNLLRA